MGKRNGHPIWLYIIFSCATWLLISLLQGKLDCRFQPLWYFLTGLTLDLFINQEEYIPSLSQEAGVRILLTPQRNIPFPVDEGFTVSPGFATSIGLRQVCFTIKTHHDSILLFQSLVYLRSFLVLIYIFILPLTMLKNEKVWNPTKTQGHPTTVSSKIRWKHFLGYPEYFYISRNAL